MAANHNSSIIHFADSVEMLLDLPEDMAQEAKDYLGEVVRSSLQSPEQPNIPQNRRIVVRHASALDTDAMRQIEPNIFGRSGAFVDQTYRIRIANCENGSLELLSPVGAIEWAIWLTQIKLLESGSTFIHCAGMEKNGQAILFPSWGGVGKTAIAKGFVRDEGWKLLGDDTVILTQEGVIHAFPRPMVLYPYHRALFPDIFNSGYGPVAPSFTTGLLTHAGVALKPLLRRMPALLAWARRNNPQSVRIPPSNVFGEDSISSKAEAKTVVWLDRDAGIEHAEIRPADDTLISRLAGTTMNEFDRHCVGLTPLMCGLGIVSFENTLGAWTDILRAGLSETSQWMLHIPAHLPVADVPDVVMDLLEVEGLFERVSR